LGKDAAWAEQQVESFRKGAEGYVLR